MNILLGLTGSVATVLAEKLVKALAEIGTVRVIVTEKAKHFISIKDLLNNAPVEFFYQDESEWVWKDEEDKTLRSKYRKGDEVLHIALRDWADIFLIAPCSANSFGKIANGLCDNLLTSVARCWDYKKPFVIALAMNTKMLDHPATKMHKKTLLDWGCEIISPQNKTLACGDVGDGALAQIDDIVADVLSYYKWIFPLQEGVCSGIPIGNHPGAFGYRRKHDIHSGVDLYCAEGSYVFPVEIGIVKAISPFTGPKAGFPWWLDTWNVAIEGKTGVVNYGEIIPTAGLKVGDHVRYSDCIGKVTPVLPKGKERPDIPGHSLSMLHLEWYKSGTEQVWKGWQFDDKEKPRELLDPTNLLKRSSGAPNKTFTMESQEVCPH